MDEQRNLDLDGLMQQMRLQIRDKRARADSAGATASPSQQFERDLGQLHNAYDLGQVELGAGRQRLAWAVRRAAQTLRRLISPIIGRQSEYNAANTRVVTHLSAEIKRLQDRLQAAVEDALRKSEENKTYIQGMTRRLSNTYAGDLAMHAQSLSELSQTLKNLEQKLAAVEQRQSQFSEQFQRLDSQKAELDQLRTYYEQMKMIPERLVRMERRLRRILSAQESNGAPAPGHPEQVPSAADAEMDYAGFEDRLRDSPGVKEKQRAYVTYFAGKSPVIDAGCGKGEFLELMREAGVEAKGLDLNLDMVLQCQEKGLEVERRDVLDYLARQPDASIGGIFSAQVIEHLTTPQLNALISLSWNKLRPGGVVVLETLNPESLFVQWRWFWMDPSHVRLVHPQTLQFMLESAGFTEVRCQFLEPPQHGMPIPPLHLGANGSPDEFNNATDYLNKLLYGSWEYALIAKR